MELACLHTFQVLTKAPRRASQWNFPPNVWLGVSVEGPEAVHRIAELRPAKAGLRFVSFEPYVRPIKADALDLHGFGWVIVGGLSRPGKGKDLAPHPNWVAELVTAARRHGAKVFIKKNAGYTEQIQEFPE